MNDCREDRLDHRANLDAAKARIQEAYEHTPPHSPQPKPALEKPEVAQLTEALTRLAGIGERAKADPGHPFEEGVTHDLLLVRDYRKSDWMRIRNELKLAGVLIGELEQHLKETIAIQCLLATAARQTNHTENPYQVLNSKMTWMKPDNTGQHVPIPLCNFQAAIIAETVIDDGAERKRRVDIGGQLASGEPLPVISIAAKEFGGMGWVSEHWGTEALVNAGMSIKDHLRCAIQSLSPPVSRHEIFAHTGWRKFGDQWKYLSASGAWGAEGLDTSCTVELPGTLKDYALQTLDSPTTAIQASLEMLAIAPLAFSVPLFLLPYRAVLATVLSGDFSLFMSGPTGSRKTEVAAIIQSYFGANWHGKHLPAAWSSTGNSLERQAFLAKDAVLVVDDFCPTGTTQDIARYHREADRLLRAQGNRAGRGRMRADGSLAPEYFPRGIVVATGEDVPRGQSLRGRMLILEISSDTINLPVLTQMQRAATEGLLAGTTGVFCQWLAPRLDQLAAALPVRYREQRDVIVQGQTHARHPTTLAGLIVTAELFAQFATDHGVVLAADWLDTLQTALRELGADQAQFLRAEDPATRFMQLIYTALSSGRCHVKPLDGLPPSLTMDMTGLGWKLRTYGSAEGERQEWEPQGFCIGRFEYGALYLLPDAAYAVAQRFASEQGSALTVSEPALRKALDARNWLLSKNQGRDARLTIRKRLPDGSSPRFLHIRNLAGKNTGNSGNNGNTDTQLFEEHDKNPVPTVPATGNSNHHRELDREQPSNFNSLNIEHINEEIPTVPTIPGQIYARLDRSDQPQEVAPPTSVHLSEDAQNTWNVLKLYRGAERIAVLAQHKLHWPQSRVICAIQELQTQGMAELQGDLVKPVQRGVA